MSLCPLLLSFLLLPVSLSLLFDQELEGIPDEVLLPLLTLFELGHQWIMDRLNQLGHLLVSSLLVLLVQDKPSLHVEGTEYRFFAR
jgi:hypothetical protein